MSAASRLLPPSWVILPLLAAVTACAFFPAESRGGPTIEFGFPAPERAQAGRVVSATPNAIDAPRGWPVHINNPIGSPVFSDLDGDGVCEVIAGDQSHVYVFDASGNLRPGWPRTTGNIDNSPAVGDIDGDGASEIVVGARGAPPKLWAFAADGTTKPGWPVSLPFQTWMNCSSPVLADLTGDGQLDVGIAFERGVAFYDGHGAAIPGWPYLWFTTQNLQWSAPAVADIDGDDSPEVVVGNNCLWSESVHVISFDGRAMPGWPIHTAPVFSSPALADLDGDHDLEIVIQDGESTWIGHSLYAWHHDGTSVAGFPITISADYESSRSNPAIADVDGDGSLEIVTATSDGQLHILRANGTYMPGYPHIIPSDVISSAQVVDINGDGLEEIFLTYYAGGNQYVSGWRLDGSVLAGFPKLLLTATQLGAHGSTHIDDIDDDGRLELAACGTDFDDGSLCVFEIDGSTYNPWSTRMDWPKIRRDAYNTGLFRPFDTASVDPGQPASVTLSLFPNPVDAGGRINLIAEPGFGRGAVAAVRVFDATGRLVNRIDVDGQSMFPVRSLIGGHGHAGVYFVVPGVDGSVASRPHRLTVTAD